MTVYKSIAQWLNLILLELKEEFSHPFTAIEPENIPLPADYSGLDFQAAGLFSSPNDITTTLIAGQIKHTDFKNFYLRKPFKEVDMRKENEEFFEKLARKIHERNLDSDFPDDGREWRSISINAGIYPAQRDEANKYADYLIPLRLVYID